MKNFLGSFFSKGSVKAWAGMAAAALAGYVVTFVAYLYGLSPVDLPAIPAGFEVYVTTVIETFMVGLSVWYFKNA